MADEGVTHYDDKGDLEATAYMRVGRYEVSGTIQPATVTTQNLWFDGRNWHIPAGWNMWDYDADPFRYGKIDGLLCFTQTITVMKKKGVPWHPDNPHDLADNVIITKMQKETKMLKDDEQYEN